MSDSKEDKPVLGRKPLGIKRTVESGQVQQQFSHGRKNTVVVEVKRRRVLGKPGETTGGAPAAAPQAEPAPAPVTPAPVAGPAKADERIARFVEAIKVTGIRSSGAESRVLMNDRVYRVNDTVERTLGVKLTKVEADQLTFADANGLVYVKGI